MKKQYLEILRYFEEKKIIDYRIEESNSIAGHTINVSFEQDFIRCHCFIFKSDNAYEKMENQFSMTRNILIANIKK